MGQVQPPAEEGATESRNQSEQRTRCGSKWRWPYADAPEPQVDRPPVCEPV